MFGKTNMHIMCFQNVWAKLVISKPTEYYAYTKVVALYIEIEPNIKISEYEKWPSVHKGLLF